MAVKIHEFFAHYRRSTLAFFALTSMLSALLAAAGAWAVWWFVALDPLLTLLTGTLLLVACNVIFSIVLFKQASEPLRVLSAAVAHVSKDPVVTPPPDVRARKFETSGLRAIVQAVYELATSNGQPAATTNTSAFAEHVLADMPCGVVALNGSKIVYANSLAPVTQQPGGDLTLDLMFEQGNTYATWLADCTANKVRDTHTWLRVPNKPAGESGQRIFDLAAYYQKEHVAGIDTILIAFDRTVSYGPEEDDMSFIAMAAHELRGPITVIRGYLDELQQDLATALQPEQKELMDRLQVSSERLSGYVNNILNVSRYDRQQFTAHLYQENLADILNSLLPDLNLRANTQNRSISLQIPADLPAIAADRSSLGEVITNLIDNAIKYSHEGGQVVIAAAPKEDMVEVTVTDTGIGIPSSVMGNLFTRFYRSHRSKQQVGGTGLGLYICKAIVEAHGGSIWVRSVEGQGSTFGFTLQTYATIADKLKSGDNKDIVQRSEGWIKNHAMYRR